MSAIKVGILTASDRCSAGINEDLSGRTIEEIITSRMDGEVASYRVVPDDRGVIAQNLREMVDKLGVDLILTTGGTGFARRDVTPEATMDVIEKIVPGMPEAMRKKSAEVTPFAMLSRATAGIRGQTLIVNLPGSPKAVLECLEVILPVLPHAVKLLKGMVKDCRDEQDCQSARRTDLNDKNDQEIEHDHNCNHDHEHNHSHNVIHSHNHDHNDSHNHHHDHDLNN